MYMYMKLGTVFEHKIFYKNNFFLDFDLKWIQNLHQNHCNFLFTMCASFNLLYLELNGGHPFSLIRNLNYVVLMSISVLVCIIIFICELILSTQVSC